jgi:hypothetical protein
MNKLVVRFALIGVFAFPVLAVAHSNGHESRTVKECERCRPDNGKP